MKIGTMTTLIVATILCVACGGTVKATGDDDSSTQDTATDTGGDAVDDPGMDVPVDTTVPDGELDAVEDTPVLDAPVDVVVDVPADTVSEPDAPVGCPSPLVDCGGVCVDLASDEDNCGTCDNTCDPGQTCGSGDCGGEVSCPPGYVDCGLMMTECRDVSGDPENCGDCGASCEDMEYCQDGACICRPGFMDCGGSCVNILSDTENCGGCGSRCADVCVGGSCMTEGDCTLDVCDSACVDTETDVRHCGWCGHDCDRDQICISGRCQDYEPAVGCAAGCEGCGACPWGESCCELDIYGVSCVEGGSCP